MPDKYQNKYRVETTRLRGYDYGAHGTYFVTICTQNRQHYFGEIVESDESETGDCAFLKETRIGQVADEYWRQIPKHYPFVELDGFVLMPNHLHGISFFNKPDKHDWVPNEFGVQSQNLAAIIRGYKSSVKRFANLNSIEFGWQSRFYDRIIRDQHALETIQNYIIANPSKWCDDELNNAGHRSAYN